MSKSIKKKDNTQVKFSIAKFLSSAFILVIILLLNKGLKENKDKVITMELIDQASKDNMALTVLAYGMVIAAVGATIYFLIKKVDLSKKIKI